MSPRLLLCSAVILQLFGKIHGSNIIFFHSLATSSHRTALWPLVEKLANSGHNITYFFPMKKGIIGSHPNVEEITPSKLEQMSATFVSEFDINLRLNDKTDEWVHQAFAKAAEMCEAFYDSPEVKEWLSKRHLLKYDLVFIDAILGDCGYGLVHLFQTKHILFTPILVSFQQEAFGIIPESSAIPEFYFHKKPSEMTFLNRVKTVISTLMFRAMFVDVMGKVEPVIKDKLNLTEFPAIREFEKNTSLLFVNSHFVEDYPMSIPPMVVSYSGLWCNTKLKPLPEKLASFIETSDAFIYISFGSAVVASAMPNAMRAEFFNAIRAFPHLKFFWKWTGPVPEDTPKNAMLLPWFPQHDILAHPKIKGFIMQTGRPSTQEAICYGVPMITIPIFGDQDYNAGRLEYIGVSINLDLKQINAAILTSSIDELITNPRYKTRTMEMSTKFKDRPLDPLENAFFWTEFVLRHDDLSILKPLSMNQPWYQRRLIDVYVFLAIVLISILFVVTIVFVKLAQRVLNRYKHKVD